MADLYAILGVSKAATQDEIKKAFRKEAPKYHPDLHPGDKKAEAKFKDLSNAYDVLSDEQKRAAYDRQATNPFQQQNYHNQQNPFHQHNPFNQTHSYSPFSHTGNSPNVDNILNEIFGRTGFTNQPTQNQHINLNYQITLEEAFNGKEVEISFSFKNQSPRTFKLQIPISIEHGMKIRYAGQGDDSFKNIPPGDLFVTISILPSAVFTRVDRYTLMAKHDIDYLDAMLGCKFNIQTIDGNTISLQTSPGVMTGTVLKASGKGMRDTRGQRGDLLIELNLVPPSLNEKQRNLIEQARKITG